MTSPTAQIADGLTALDAAWGESPDVSRLSDTDLLGVNGRVAELRRHVDALHARVAAEIASRSRAERGKEGLARQAGFRTPAKLIASATGGHTGDATRLISVGDATAPRLSLDGTPRPAKHPHVAEGIAAGSLSVSAAAAISGMLDALPPRVAPAQRLHAEKALVEQAPLLTLDELQAVLRRAEGVLDPEGLEQTVAALRGERSLKIHQDRSGMTVFSGRLDPETAAPIVTAIQSIVTHQLRVTRGRNAPEPAHHNDSPSSASPGQIAGAEGGRVGDPLTDHGGARRDVDDRDGGATAKMRATASTAATAARPTQWEPRHVRSRR